MNEKREMQAIAIDKMSQQEGDQYAKWATALLNNEPGIENSIAKEISEEDAKRIGNALWELIEQDAESG